MAEEFEIQVGVKIDDSSIKAQIDGIKSKPIKIPIEADTEKLKKINKEIKNISNVGKVKLDADVSDILKKVNKVTKITKDGVVVKVKTEGINEFGQLTTVVEKFKKGVSTGIDVKVSSEDIIKTKSDAQQLIEELKTIDSIKIKVDSGDVGNQVSKIESDFKKIINVSDDAQKAMDEFTLAQKKLLDTRANGNNEELIKSAEEYELALKRIKNQIDINARSQKNAASAAKLQQRVEKLSQKMSLWLHDNSAAAEDFGAQIKTLIAQLEMCDNSVKFDNISSQFDKITTKAKLAGKTGLSFGDRLKQQFTKYSSYFSAASVVMAGVQATRAMFQNVIEVDTAMTELKRVTDLSVSQYSNLYDGLTASAQKYGVALTDLISATADWSRAGFDAETASGLAEATAVYQHIADLDYDTASENQLTAFKGFEQQLMNDFQGNAEDAVWYITDVFNELDNKYSVTAAGIGEALKRSASSLQVAGNTMQESAAMVTGITEVTQDPEKAGNALKVVSMRLRGMKGELQELGEETDENVENLSKMQGDILNLTKGKVNIFDNAGEFKSTYEILQGIADVWKELSTIEQADLLETIAGKHRANDVAALLNNWQNVEKAFISATEAEGSAMEEQAKYAESLQGRLNSLQAMWQEFSNTFLSSNLVKGAISGLTGLLSLIEKIIDTIGGIGTAGIIGTLIMGFKHRSGVKGLFSDLTSLVSGGIKSFGDLKAAASLAGESIFKSFSRSPAALLTGIGAVTTALSIGLQLWDNYQAGIRAARQESIDASNSFSDAFSSFEQVYVKYSDKSILTAEEEGELATAINGTINALGDKSAALKDAVGAQSEYASNLDNIMKAELEQAQTLANEGKKAAKESLKDFWDKDAAGGYQWFSWKDAKADFVVPTNVDKEWKYIKDIVDDPDFKKYINNSKHGKDLLGDGWSYFRFDRDTGLDGYIEQLNYATEIRDRLSKAASETGDDSYLDSDFFKTVSESVDSMSAGIDEYVNQTYAAEKATYQLKNGIPKTIDEFYNMQDAVLSASASTVEARAAILDVMSSEYGGIFDLSSAEAQIKQIQALTNGIDSIGDKKTKTFETFIDMKTKVNSGEVTVGEYTDAMDAANKAINKIAETDLSAANALRVQLGLELDVDGKIDDEIKHLKDKFVTALTDNGVSKEVAEGFTDSLSKTELEAAVDLSASGEIDLKNIDTKNLDASIKKTIEDHAKYLEAIRFNINIEAEADGIDKLNTALSESRAATGLTEESIESIKARYNDLEGYDPSAIFEKTTTGVRLNVKALNALEEQLVATNKAASDKKLGALAKRYKEIEALRDSVGKDTDEYKAYQNELDGLNKEIEAAKLAASAYDGLTSSYNNWINAQKSGQAGDMYDQIVEGRKSAEELAKARKWGNTELQGYIEMFSSPDSLDNATPEQYANAWASAINKSNRYFKEGTKGIDNFIADVAAANSDLVKMNSDGSWNIVAGFDTEDWAKAAKVSESTVESIFGQMEEYGFDVPIGIDESSIDDLATKAESASSALKSSMGEDFEIKVNTDITSTKEAETEIDNLKAQRDEINNSSATVEVKQNGVDAVNDSIEAVINKKIELEQPSYMQLNASQVKSTMTEALSALQDYQNAVDEVSRLTGLQDAGIGIDTSQLDAAKNKVDETAKAIAELDGDVKLAIGLDASDGVDTIKQKIENGEVKLTVDTDIDKSATEELASNVEKIKDKDVTIKVKVDGLDDVKDLTKSIELATSIDGNVDALSKFSNAAKGLNDVNDNIVRTITADVYGNLDGNRNLDSLDKFTDSAEKLDDVESSYVTVTANLKSNLNENISNVDKLEDFAKGAKALQGVGSSNVSVKANLEANIGGILGYNPDLENIEKFAESAERLSGVPSADVSVKANLDANVGGILGYNADLDNLDKFADSARNLAGISNADVSVKANLDANVGGILGYNPDLNNLDKFADSAERLGGISSSEVDVKANLEANTGGILGYNPDLNNLDKFADAAERLGGIDSSDVSVKANLDANTGGVLGYNPDLDNLDRFIDGAKRLESVESSDVTVSATLNANTGGILGYNADLDNLDKFADGAKKLENIESSDVVVTAKLDANTGGFLGSNPDLDNLDKFTDAAKKLEGVKSSDVTVSATLNANTGGFLGINPDLDNLDKFADAAEKLDGIKGSDVTVTATLDANIDSDDVDNLSSFSDGAKKLQDVDSKTVDIEANLQGDIDGNTADNLSKFAEGAKKLQGVGNASSTVTANLKSEGLGNNLFGNNSALDNIEKFANAAKSLKNVGDASATVTANLKGEGVGNNVFGSNSTLDNLGKFAEGAKKIKSVGDASATVTANLEGNGLGNSILGSNSTLDNLGKFAEGAKKLQGVEDVSATVTANLNGNIGNNVLGSNSKLSNLSSFTEGAEKLKSVNSKTVNIEANLNGNLGSSGGAIENLPAFASTASDLQGVSSKDVSITANVNGNLSDSNVANLSEFKTVASNLPPSSTVTVNANVDTDGINSAKTSLQGLSDSGVMHDYNANVNVAAKVSSVDDTAVQNYQTPPKDGKVTYTVDSSQVDSWVAPPKTGVVNYSASVEALTDAQKYKTGTITYKAKVEGAPVVDGTAHVNGTAGSAFKQGSWSTKESGTALMGELGRELIVRDGRFFTVGDNGAEFAKYQKGDIIFNHKFCLWCYLVISNLKSI